MSDEHIFADLLKKYFIWSQSIWLASPTRSMILRCILFFQNKIKKSNKKVSEAHKTFLQRSISILIFHNKLFFLCWKESHLNSRGHSPIIQNYSLQMSGLCLMKLCHIFVIRKFNCIFFLFFISRDFFVYYNEVVKKIKTILDFFSHKYDTIWSVSLDNSMKYKHLISK